MDQKILREYLIALGWSVDERGSKKVDNVLRRTDIRAAALGKTLVGLGATVVAMTTAFAKSMERMYYSARYADTTVSSLQALEYGARNIGLEAGKGGAALKNMAAAIRANPGLIGLLNSLGVEVKGRDKADVLIDLVAALKKMPSYISQQYAAMFGIDPETLFNLQEGLDKMREAQEERKKMAADMGFDGDKAAETAKTYMNMWREVTERASLFGMVVGEAILPYVQELVKETNQLMIKWSSIVRDLNAPGNEGSFLKKLKEGLTGKADGERVTLTDDAKKRLGLPEEELPDLDGKKGVGIPRLVQRWERWRDRRNGNRRFGSRVATDERAVDASTDMSDFKDRNPELTEAERIKRVKEALAAGSAGGRILGDYARVEDIPDNLMKPGPRVDVARATPEKGDDNGEVTHSFDPKEYLAKLEKRYALPPGVLDRVWKQESNRGDPKWMRSPAGAKGHFGFMDDTAKAYGLKDPDDFKESAEASARMWRDLLKQYKGDARLAAAAYNWGSGNMQKYGLGRAPEETRKYMDAVAGPAPTVNANPQINIYGVSDPKEAADRVLMNQRTINADVVRNMSPKVR